MWLDAHVAIYRFSRGSGTVAESGPNDHLNSISSTYAAYESLMSTIRHTHDLVHIQKSQDPLSRFHR